MRAEDNPTLQPVDCIIDDTRIAEYGKTPIVLERSSNGNNSIKWCESELMHDVCLLGQFDFNIHLQNVVRCVLVVWLSIAAAELVHCSTHRLLLKSEPVAQVPEPDVCLSRDCLDQQPVGQKMRGNSERYFKRLGHR
jgi:hypothetical protein